VGDPEAMIKGYATLAQKAKSEALRAAYGAWTAMQLHSAGRDADALEYWQIARRHRPQSTQALLGVVRGLVARKERTKIKPLFADAPAELAPVQADALIALGDVEGAADALSAWADRLETEGLPERRLGVLLEVERLLAGVADWQGAHDALVKRRALCRNPAVQQAADAARRWMLSEELPETDAAWDLYRELHDERPADRQVTDALSRIACARGDIALAIGYLQELADTAPEPKEAARLRRRIGEVYESSGQLDSARQAYLDALDHVHDDRDALEGLRRLAQQAKDWPGLVAVLQREASSADHARQIELRRQIARVTEDKIGDRKVAIDAWRALLELDPKNREGLDHLLRLSEEQGAWALYVETGEVLAQLLTGRDQATLLRKVGVACQDRLGREDAHRYFEQAVAVPPPDAEAASRLEGIARARADWPGAVRALRLQAQADVEPTAKVNALLRAARVEIEALHDREAAARSYRQVLELRPDETSALKFMANHLFEARKFDEALPICERLEPQLAAEDDLEDFDTRIELSTFYYSFAEILRRKGDDDAAIPRYERALALNPTHLPSLEAVAPLYSATQAWDKAERVYRQLLQLSGGQGEKTKVATTYTELGIVERALGAPDKAYKRFTKALEIHPNHVGALKGMALILEDRQDWSNLLNVYNNIIYHATVPDDVIDAYMTKGRILDDQMQRQDKAAQHYQRSLDFDPNQPAAYLRLAELAMRRDAYKEAGDLVDNALKLDPDLVQSFRPLLLAVKSAAWQDAGHTPEAERCLRECKMLDPALHSALGDAPLQDLETMRRVIKDRLPR
jgi:tetratricopeptide (TPR) repeat protein